MREGGKTGWKGDKDAKLTRKCMVRCCRFAIQVGGGPQQEPVYEAVFGAEDGMDPTFQGKARSACFQNSQQLGRYRLASSANYCQATTSSDS